MITVVSAIKDIVSSSDFALEGLQNGCLNLSAYANTIKDEVEKRTKKPVQKGSLVVALARLSTSYAHQKYMTEDYQLHNLVSRSNLIEIAYHKTATMQQSLAGLYARRDIQQAQFLVATTGINEIAIVAHAELAATILGVFPDDVPKLQLTGLASLTMQVGEDSINIPRQSYTVIKQLALRDITIVEYISSPTELSIILYEKDLKESFVILHDKFFS